MKTRKTILLFCTLLLVIAGVVKAEDPVVFNDPALETAVRQKLGIPTNPIMPADMLDLTQLEARSKGIVNLTGLEYATNLRILFLGKNNNITDISPLAGLTALEENVPISVGGSMTTPV